ncbi:MAG TPA: carboxypeptidase-like regulatory domain-containing protein [Pyrinomonadaceae bacterium]
MVRSRWFSLLMLVGLLLSVTVSGYAQGATGQLSGTVTDAQGARVQGASVKVTNRDTALERDVVTDENGNFAVQLLPPGKYR